MLTPIDQIASQNHLQLFKAAIPYFHAQQQKNLSVMVKIMELQNIIRFYNHNPKCVSACAASNDSPSLLDILSDMRNYCEGGDQQMLDQWIQLAGTLELYSVFAQSPDIFSQDPGMFMQNLNSFSQDQDRSAPQ